MMSNEQQQQETKQLYQYQKDDESNPNEPEQEQYLFPLPVDVLSNIFSFFLDSPKDLEVCSNVNLVWNRVANTLWKQLANYRYNKSIDIIDHTIRLYDHNYKELLFDDNRKGALRIFHINQPCYWKFNNHFHNHRFFCCIVVSMIWDRRPSSNGGGGIYLFIDARGESDLRPPILSSIKASDRTTCFQPNQFISCSRKSEVHNETNASNSNQQLPTANHFSQQFRDQWRRNVDLDDPLGHYKGLLFYEFQNEDNLTSTFDRDIIFCYANIDHNRDYESIPIFTGFGNTTLDTNNNINNDNNNDNQNSNIDNNGDDNMILFPPHPRENERAHLLLSINNEQNNNNNRSNSNTNNIHYHEYITYDQLLNLGVNESHDVEVERWNPFLPTDLLRSRPNWWV